MHSCNAHHLSKPVPNIDKKGMGLTWPLHFRFEWLLAVSLNSFTRWVARGAEEATMPCCWARDSKTAEGGRYLPMAYMADIIEKLCALEA